jgi:hypothetical protein
MAFVDDAGLVVALRNGADASGNAVYFLWSM